MTAYAYGHSGDSGKTAAGTYTWTAPASGVVTVECYGGGGSGGSDTTPFVGNAGGESAFKDGSTYLCRASGGGGGTKDAGAGAGGTALVGTGHSGASPTTQHVGGGAGGPTSDGSQRTGGGGYAGDGGTATVFKGAAATAGYPAGGGGAGDGTTDNYLWGGGGGGYATITAQAVTAGHDYTVIVGAGGATVSGGFAGALGRVSIDFTAATTYTDTCSGACSLSGTSSDLFQLSVTYVDSGTGSVALFGSSIDSYPNNNDACVGSLLLTGLQSETWYWSDAPLGTAVLTGPTGYPEYLEYTSDAQGSLIITGSSSDLYSSSTFNTDSQVGSIATSGAVSASLSYDDPVLYTVSLTGYITDDFTPSAVLVDSPMGLAPLSGPCTDLIEVQQSVAGLVDLRGSLTSRSGSVTPETQAHILRDSTLRSLSVGTKLVTSLEEHFTSRQTQ